MSIELLAYLRRHDVPTRDRWQAAIDECGFELRLHEGLQPLESSGFVPCELDGTDSGFEIRFERSPEPLADHPVHSDMGDCCVAFSWSSSIDESACALIASYALAKAFGAVVSYEGGAPWSLERLLVETRECLAEARSELGIRRGTQERERPESAVATAEVSTPETARRIHGSKRTPAAWTRLCLELLQEIHPGYARNRDVKGRFIEFIRPDPSGLWISHNFIRIGGCYYLCFALTLTTRLHEGLYHPLFAGCRFDHNRTIHRQVFCDLGLVRGAARYPDRLWSSGEWRSNTLDYVQRAFAVSEEHLLPFYRDGLRAGKQRLLEFFQAAQRLIPRLDPAASVSAQARNLGVDPATLASFPLRSARLDALAVARGGHCYAGVGPDSNTVDMSTISPEVLALHFASELAGEKERLSELVAIVAAL